VLAPLGAAGPATLDHALPANRAVLAEVRVGDARHLPQLLADLAGQVDLLVTSPSYACETGVIDKPAWRPGQPLFFQRTP